MASSRSSVVLAGVALLVLSMAGALLLWPEPPCDEALLDLEETGCLEPSFSERLAQARARCAPEVPVELLIEGAWCAYTHSRHVEALERAREGWVRADELGSRELAIRARKRMFNVLHDLGDLRSGEAVLADIEARIRPEELGLRAWLISHRALLDWAHDRPSLALVRERDALALSDRAPGHPGRYPLTLNLIESLVAAGRVEEARERLDALVEWVGPSTDHEERPALSVTKARVALAETRPEAAMAELDRLEDDALNLDWRIEVEALRGRAEEARGRSEPALRAYRRAVRAIENLRDEARFDDFRASTIETRREPYEAVVRLELEAGRPEIALAMAEQSLGRAFLDAFARGEEEVQPDPTPFRIGPALERASELRDLTLALTRSPSRAPPRSSELLQALRGHRIALYYWTGSTLRLFSVAEGQVRPVELAGGPEGALLRELERFVADPADEALGARLGERLFPEAIRPPPGEVLYVVPDGILTRFPFAALRLGERPLPAELVSSMVPNLSTLAGLASRPASTWGPVQVLGVSAGDLPAAAAEADWVAARFDEEPRVGPRATAASLQAARRARLLHVSSHARSSGVRPELILTDSRLRPSDLLRLDIAPRLAVLSSCSSGRSWTGGFWGSLAGALLAAGTRSVVASLWSIEDAGTFDFVQDFYRAGGERTPARALAAVQTRWAAEGRSPELWAAFFHLGEVTGVEASGLTARPAR